MSSSNEIEKSYEPVPTALEAAFNSVSIPQSYDSIDSKVLRSDQVEYCSSNENLGAGGFGIVKKAKFRGKMVAVKTLKMDDAKGQLKAMEMFV